MADISKIKLPDGNEYNIKDTISGYITSSDLPTPLIGTTANTTPTQVAAALTAGRNVEITHTDSTWGAMKFYQGWVNSPALGVLGASGIFLYNTQILNGELYGNLSTDTWGFFVQSLAITEDIPTKTSDLTNDSGFISNIKTINNTSLVGSGNVAVQPTLVSGTNIKTINNTSLLGSGNISIVNTREVPASSGTTLSLVNTGDMYSWNNKAQAKIVRWTESV